MHKSKSVSALPWKHHTFCLTHEATFAEAQRTIHAFYVQNKDKTQDQECTEFALTHSHLIYFPEELYRLTWLQKLSLNHHRVSILPESIEQLHNLQYLYLDHNRLSYLPNAVSTLVHLKVLSADCNKLKFLCPLGMSFQRHLCL
jgi:Leucine-rich repeat (LRR) protein